MYPLFLVLIWRRKLLIVATSILLLFGIWLWTIHDDRNIRGDRIFLIGNIKYMNHDRDQQKVDFADNAQSDDRQEFVSAARTTVKNVYSRPIGSKEGLSQLSALLSNKDAAKVLQNIERHSHDMGGRSRKAERALQLSGKSMRYNHELQKMVSSLFEEFRGFLSTSRRF